MGLKPQRKSDAVSVPNCLLGGFWPRPLNTPLAIAIVFSETTEVVRGFLPTEDLQFSMYSPSSVQTESTRAACGTSGGLSRSQPSASGLS